MDQGRERDVTKSTRSTTNITRFFFYRTSPTLPHFFSHLPCHSLITHLALPTPHFLPIKRRWTFQSETRGLKRR